MRLSQVELRWVCVVGTLLWGGWSAAPARAFEDQATLELGAGYARLFSHRLPTSGALFDLGGSLGLGPSWTFRGRVSYGIHPDAAPLHVGLVGADLLYMIDVLEWVPVLGVGLDAGLRARRGERLRTDAAGHLVFGVDYLLSRSLALGLEARPYLVWTAFGRDPFYLALSMSVAWIFDR